MCDELRDSYDEIDWLRIEVREAIEEHEKDLRLVKAWMRQWVGSIPVDAFQELASIVGIDKE